ncbi:MAG: beta-aspartyl-peptidase [Tissierellia bacterium]|nr:beta-aspartyl-peptidase [Tissierellia bacterium]
MITIKQIQVFTPKDIGVKDVFIGGGKILEIGEGLELRGDVISGKGQILVPGFIDHHVHVTGGGGEKGFSSRAPEVKYSDLVKAGITTVLGLLGTDGITRSIENLVAKLYALREQGLSAWGFTGSYRYPSPTLTGDIEKDIAFIDPIIGTKIALSDHRSSNLSTEDLALLATETRIGAMIGNKAGKVIVHMGDGRNHLKKILEITEVTDLPMGIFHPTHCNRNDTLLEESLEFLKMGGSIDLTCNISNRRPAEVIKKAIRKGIPTKRITISSDGGGSYSTYDDRGNLETIGISSVSSLLEEFQWMIRNDWTVEEALPYFTLHPAHCLKLKEKGQIKAEKDADLLLLNQEMKITNVIARGKLLMREGELLDLDRKEY